MQLGSDGILSCASCHFHAGADTRSKNQLNPNTWRVNNDRSENPDNTFNTSTGGQPPGVNYQLTRADFPFHRLSDPNNRGSAVVSDTNDVAASQGVFRAKFVDVIPGNPEDVVVFQDDPVFNVQGREVRRVEPRHTPTVINAVSNFRNFWDGRAQNIFNGVNSFGRRDPIARVLRAETPATRPQPVKVRLRNSSLASQSVEPPPE